MKLMTFARDFVRQEEGQDLIEYALLVALIALVAVAACAATLYQACGIATVQDVLPEDELAAGNSLCPPWTLPSWPARQAVRCSCCSARRPSPSASTPQASCSPRCS